MDRLDHGPSRHSYIFLRRKRIIFVCLPFPVAAGVLHHRHRRGCTRRDVHLEAFQCPTPDIIESYRRASLTFSRPQSLRWKLRLRPLPILGRRRSRVSSLVSHHGGGDVQRYPPFDRAAILLLESARVLHPLQSILARHVNVVLKVESWCLVTMLVFSLWM